MNHFLRECLLSLDDRYLKALAASLSAEYQQDVLREAVDLEDALSELEDDAYDLPSLLEEFGPPDDQNFWSELLRIATAAAERREEQREREAEQREEFRGRYRDYFSRTEWSRSAGRHPMARGIEIGKEAAVVGYAHQFLSKHGELPAGEHEVTWRASWLGGGQERSFKVRFPEEP